MSNVRKYIVKEVSTVIVPRKYKVALRSLMLCSLLQQFEIAKLRKELTTLKAEVLLDEKDEETVEEE